MAAISIKPEHVSFSNGLFDSDKQYIKLNQGGPIYWPSPTVHTVGARQPGGLNITILYKNGVGGVPALYSGSFISFRAEI